jgi:uncharacterized membrane protein
MSTSVAGKEKFIQLPVAILIAEIVFILTTILNIPVARQVVGFFFLTFVPGFALLRLLRFKLERVESILFAVGLSIAFLMGVGLFMNLLGPLIGISTPLSLIPFMVVTNAIVILLLFLDWHDHEYHGFSISSKKLVTFGLILSAILVLCIAGTLLVDSPPHTDNSLLLLMLLSLSVLVGLAAFSKKLVPAELYPPILFVVALALLFHVSLFSNYIVGGDIFGEYDAFRLTAINSYWNPAISGKLQSMLSVTILPTIYSDVLNLDGTWILKIIYPLIFAFVPLGLYQLLKSRVSKEVAFFSVFFFVSDLTFFTEVAELGRQMIGELFYILLFVTLFSKNVKGSAKWLLFAVFSFGLVVSHYAMAYIFLGLIFAVWLVGFLRKRKTIVPVGMVALFAILTFSWFIYVSSASTFNALTQAANTISSNFVSNFFNPQSRGTLTLEAVGASGINSFWHIIGRYVYYVTEAFIVIGFLGLLLKKRRSFLDDDFNLLVLCNILLLGACIVIPNFAATFTVTRFYEVTLFFLAPLCVLGGIDVLKLLSRKKVKEKYLGLIVVLVVLIPSFFFQTGFIYEVSKEQSSSLPLSAYRMDPLTLASMGVISEPEVSGAAWLSQYQNSSRFVYADTSSGSIFAYTGVQNGVLLSLGVAVPSGSYVYLRQYNVYDGIVFSSSGSVGEFNVSQIVPSLNTTNIIYSSGSCEIYEVPPS